jgi:hypothetical protein
LKTGVVHVSFGFFCQMHALTYFCEQVSSLNRIKLRPALQQRTNLLVRLLCQGYERIVFASAWDRTLGMRHCRESKQQAGLCTGAQCMPCTLTKHL